MKKILAVISLVLFTSLTLTGCDLIDKATNTGDNTATSDNSNVAVKGNVTEISIRKSAFPVQVTIKKGQTVKWINKDSTPHSIKFQSLISNESDTLNKDDYFEYKFNQLGEFDYTCGFHSTMKGEIIVTN